MRAYTVIESGQYSLLSNYADVFDIHNQGHGEVVFSVQFHYDSQLRDFRNQYHLFYLSYYDDQPGIPRSLDYGRAWRRLRPTEFAFILDERAREMMGEVNRWFDLVRTGTFLERVREHNPEAAPLVEEHHALRPIPQTQIDAIQGGVSEFPQNAGYKWAKAVSFFAEARR